MWRNKTIFKKIFFGIMILIVVTLMSYYGFIVFYEYKINTEMAVKESIELSEKINRALNDYVTQIDGTITTFYYELYQNKKGALASLLTGRDRISEEERLWQKEELEKYFSQLFLMREDFVDVYIYKNQGIVEDTVVMLDFTMKTPAIRLHLHFPQGAGVREPKVYVAATNR